MLVFSKSIVGCIVGSSRTAAFNIRPVRNMHWVHKRHSECTYDMAMIDCFNVPAKNGSRAYILYQDDYTGTIIAAESDCPLFVPALRVSPKSGKNSTVIACTSVYGTPPLMDHWLATKEQLV